MFSPFAAHRSFAVCVQFRSPRAASPPSINFTPPPKRISHNQTSCATYFLSVRVRVRVYPRICFAARAASSTAPLSAAFEPHQKQTTGQHKMGAYLAQPEKKKDSADESNELLDCGSSSMQGWRTSQEVSPSDIYNNNLHTCSSAQCSRRSRRRRHALHTPHTTSHTRARARAKPNR